MGIAKTMNAVGDYSFYSPDYKQFARILGNLLKVNFNAYFFSCFSDETYDDRAPEFFDFQFNSCCALHVNAYQYNEGEADPENTFLVYEVLIPVDFEHENELKLEFWPNGLFQLNFLPFSNYWRFFIDDLMGISDKYVRSHDEIVAPVLKIRETCLALISKLNCSEIIIWTDARYQTEDQLIYHQFPGKTNTIQEVKYALQTLDRVRLYPLSVAIQQLIEIICHTPDCTDVAFTDTTSEKELK